MANGNPFKLPWKVIYCALAGTPLVEKIVDCENETVVETDMGVYGPTVVQAAFIVAAVNATMPQGPIVHDYRER